ncbi:MAG: type II toxin-antitoxin system VapC family toxin [Thermoproteota archaeon]
MRPILVVVDTSVLLASLLPDEPTHAAAKEVLRRALLPEGWLQLVSTTLLPYELTNGLWQAVRAGRVPLEGVETLLAQFEIFDISLHPVPPKAVLSLAKHLGYPSAYDVAYLALAEALQAPFLTADRRLYNVVHGKFTRIVWITDFLSG